MTPRQNQCLEFLRSYIGEHGFSPSFDEIDAALGNIGKSSVSRIIDALVERGHISRIRYRTRSITLGVAPCEHLLAVCVEARRVLLYLGSENWPDLDRYLKRAGM